MGLTTLVLLSAPLTLMAQTPPDAARLLEQQRPAAPQPQPAQPAQSVQAPRAAATAATPADNTTIEITGFVFEGQSVLTQAQLREHLLATLALTQATAQAAVQATAQAITLPAKVSFGQLRQAVAALGEAYAQDGFFLLRMAIPPQDLAANAGQVRIRVIEGRLDALRINRAASAAAPAAAPATPTERDSAELELIQKTLAAQNIAQGNTLLQAPTERALLLIGQRLGAPATASLAPGAQPGGTELTFEAQERPKSNWRGQISTDNYGNRYTGVARVQAELGAQHLAAVGDLLSLKAQTSNGLQFAALGYALPVGHDGWLLEASASALNYALCCQFQVLQAKGSAQAVAIGARYPLRLSAVQRVDLEFNAGQRRSQDETIAGTTSLKSAVPLLVGISFNETRAFSGDLLQNGRLAYSQTKLSQHLFPNPNIPEQMRKLRIDYAANYALSSTQQLQLRFAAQQALTNLDSSEKFTLGGPGGVRGWPAGEAVGDSGQTLALQWRKTFAASQAGQLGQWSLVSFFDAGRIQQQKSPTANSLPAGQPNNYSLSSVGLGLSYSTNKWQIQSQLSRALGSNPGASATGLNSDGRTTKNRLWVSASVDF